MNYSRPRWTSQTRMLARGEARLNERVALASVGLPVGADHVTLTDNVVQLGLCSGECMGPM